MTSSSLSNLSRVLRYVHSSPMVQREFVRESRDRLAGVLRAARVRVKANKLAHGGIYV